VPKARYALSSTRGCEEARPERGSILKVQPVHWKVEGIGEQLEPEGAPGAAAKRADSSWLQTKALCSLYIGRQFEADAFEDSTGDFPAPCCERQLG